MILDPVNSVSSPDFYTQVSGQSFGRSFLYLCYLGLVFSVLTTFAVKIKVGPALDETFEWLAKAAPVMTYADGKITSNAPGPVKLQHPKLPEIAVMIDTTRTDAVTPAQLEEAKVMAFLTANSFYLRHQSGKIEVYDLSKASANSKPLQIGPDFFRSASSLLARIMYPLAFVIFFCVFVMWKLFASLIYSVVALIVNAISGAGLAWASLLNIAIYAQTLVILLQILALYLPMRIPGLPVISLAITTGYIWLGVKRHSPSSPPAQA